MSRIDKILGGIDVSTSSGLEIGALCNPLVRKTDGDIGYVDYADRAFLQKVYQGNALIDLEAIVEVDYIWGENTLAEATNGRRFDYIVASHVIEHVPDLITWIRELISVLVPTGQICLAIPDRRYTFDLLRRESELADVLHAHLVRARKPLPAQVLDYFLNAVAVNSTEAWSGRVNIGAIRATQATQVTAAMDRARQAHENGDYHDAHCWVFTPRSLGLLFASLADAGYLEARCARFIDTARNEIEFFVAVAPEQDRAVAAASWREMAANAHAGPDASTESQASAEHGDNSEPECGPATPPPLWARLRTGLANRVRGAR